MDDNRTVLLADDNDDDVSDYGRDFKEWYLDVNILNRLKQNDPTIEKLYIRFEANAENEFDANGINWEQEGSRAISENTHIKSLAVSMWSGQGDFPYTAASKENAKALLQAISNNRTIRHLTMSGSSLIDEGHTMEILSPCFQYNRILRLELNSFNLSPRSAQILEDTVSKGNSLRIFKIQSLNGGTDELVANIITSLKTQCNLRKLELIIDFRAEAKAFGKWCSALGNLLQNTSTLAVLDTGYTHIGDMGADSLGDGLANNTTLNKLSLHPSKHGPCEIISITSAGWATIFKGLTNSRSSLEELDLSSNELDNDAATALAAAVIEIKSLRSLNLSQVKSNSWRSLLTPLPNSTGSVLEKLVLRNSNIDDEGLTELIDALGNNSSLKELDIGGNRSPFTRAGLISFIRHVGNPISSLEGLDLSGSFSSGGIINDELAGALANALRTNTKLKRLNLSHSPAITPAGWRTFFDMFTLRNSNSSSLERFDLSNNNIDDNAVVSLVRAYPRLCSMKYLSLWSNDSITPVAMRGLSNLLRNPTCLEELRLGDYTNTNGVNIDEVVVAFANELVNNTSLKYLYLGYSYVVTSRGRVALSTLLCNKVDIDSIFTSNHTLQRVHPYRSPNLDLNKNENKFEVARQKIIRYHFLNGEDNIEDLLDIELGVLPHAMSWVNRDDTGHSLLYQLVRCLPSLFDYESMKAEAAAGMKRKGR